MLIWLAENKQWVFSGIGVTILIAIFAFFRWLFPFIIRNIRQSKKFRKSQSLGINTFSGLNDNKLEAKFQQKAKDFFYYYFEGQIQKILQMRYPQELQSYHPDYEQRENQKWVADLPRLLEVKNGRLYWISPVTVIADGFQIDKVALNKLYHNKGGGDGPLSMIPPLPLKRIAEAGRSIFEITWSARIVKSDQLEDPNIENVRYLKDIWKDVHADGHPEQP